MSVKQTKHMAAVLDRVQELLSWVPSLRMKKLEQPSCPGFCRQLSMLQVDSDWMVRDD